MTTMSIIGAMTVLFCFAIIERVGVKIVATDAIAALSSTAILITT
jgi:hypothetical protein